MIADGLFDRFPMQEVDIRKMAPVAVNNLAAAEAVCLAATSAFGGDRVIRAADPIMASEDFAFMLDRVPGAFFFVGQDGPYPHHPAFVFDTDIIPTGAAVLTELARTGVADIT